MKGKSKLSFKRQKNQFLNNRSFRENVTCFLQLLSLFLHKMNMTCGPHCIIACLIQVRFTLVTKVFFSDTLSLQILYDMQGAIKIALVPAKKEPL